MSVPWSLLTILSLMHHTESRCSPTSYYKNCWIRRYPGIFIDVEESQRRGAQLLKYYQEETALKCSRTCCLTRNFSCNLAVFHYDTIQENVNCFHLHCPTLESCILTQRGNVILYNITKGVDPDLLVFGKYFTSNVRVLPNFYTRANVSEPLASDKRQFNHPPLLLPRPLTVSPTARVPRTTIATTTATTTTTQSSTQGTTHYPITSTLSSTPGTHARTTTTTNPSAYTSHITSAYQLTHKKPIANPQSPTQQPTSTAGPAATSCSTSPPANTDGNNKREPNDTRNHTAAAGGGESGQDGHGGGESPPPGGSSPGWHVLAHSLLVAAVTVVTILMSCCCSVLLVVSWRGRRKRRGRYRTTWRGKGGSMRLVKYVIVRES